MTFGIRNILFVTEQMVSIQQVVIEGLCSLLYLCLLLYLYYDNCTSEHVFSFCYVGKSVWLSLQETYP